MKMTFTANNNYATVTFTEVVTIDHPSSTDKFSVQLFCDIHNQFFDSKGGGEEDHLTRDSFRALGGMVGEDTISLTEGNCHYMLRVFIPSDVVISLDESGKMIWN